MTNIDLIFERVIKRLVELSSGEVFKPKRQENIKFNLSDHPELVDEFFNLIATAYAEIGGHAKLKSVRDLLGTDWDWWEGVDLHGTPDFDLIMFGEKTKYGVKFAGVGHDGSSDAKRSYISQRARDLIKPGYYVEVSGKIADILMSKGAPIVSDYDTVERVLGKKIKRLEDGWYIRSIGGSEHKKIMLGKPRT